MNRRGWMLMRAIHAFDHDPVCPIANVDRQWLRNRLHHNDWKSDDMHTLSWLANAVKNILGNNPFSC